MDLKKLIIIGCLGALLTPNVLRSQLYLPELPAAELLIKNGIRIIETYQHELKGIPADEWRETPFNQRDSLARKKKNEKDIAQWLTRKIYISDDARIDSCYHYNRQGVYQKFFIGYDSLGNIISFQRKDGRLLIMEQRSLVSGDTLIYNSFARNSVYEANKDGLVFYKREGDKKEYWSETFYDFAQNHIVKKEYLDTALLVKTEDQWVLDSLGEPLQMVYTVERFHATSNKNERIIYAYPLTSQYPHRYPNGEGVISFENRFVKIPRVLEDFRNPFVLDYFIEETPPKIVESFKPEKERVYSSYKYLK